MSALTIVGLSGKAQSGKDEIAKRYFLPMGYRVASLADHHKIWMVATGAATWEEVFVTKPEHVRADMQRSMQRARETVGKTVWCEAVLATIKLAALRDPTATKWVVPDVRYFSEVRFLQEHDGVVFRVFAPDRAADNALTAEQRAHVSEVELDVWDPVFRNGKFEFPNTMPRIRPDGRQVEEPLWDAVIDNRYGWASTLDDQMTQIAKVHDLISPTQVLRAWEGAIETGARWTEMLFGGSEGAESVDELA